MNKCIDDNKWVSLRCTIINDAVSRLINTRINKCKGKHLHCVNFHGMWEHRRWWIGKIRSYFSLKKYLSDGE